MTNENYLAHYGVKGMKWGVRKAANSISSKISSAREKRSEQREQMKKITNNPANQYGGAEVTRLKRAQKPLPVQVAKRMGTTLALQTTLGLLTGKTQQDVAKFANADAKGRMALVAKQMSRHVPSTAFAVAKDNALGARSLRNYDSSGKRTSKSKIFEQEDWIEAGLDTAYMTASVASKVLPRALAPTVRRRQENQRRFNDLFEDGRILEQTVDNVIYQSADLGQIIIDNVRR